ncbi:MAG: hypothetical protein COA84_14160 [Robiginitomaculum sp.]|nr:MAG: hypothetical protein COA84_14160 [Robiginitomaculum sp.]
MINPEFVEFLESNHYYHIVHHEESDTYSCLTSLMFTTAILHDLDGAGYGSRFCFESEDRALFELGKWLGNGFADDKEPTGWIARR